MRWLPFSILAAITIVLQTTIVPAMAIASARPDWMLILAVHYALWGRWPEAAIAAWILGLLVDLQTSFPLYSGVVGLYAFAYGLAVCLILRVRTALFRDHFLTQMLLTGILALGVHLFVNVFHWWQARTAAATQITSMLTLSVFTAVYTAVWAPYLQWPLIKASRWTGLPVKRTM